MNSALARRRSLWVALTAILMAWAVPTGAKACSPAKMAIGSCVAACGCCEKAPAHVEPSRDFAGAVLAPGRASAADAEGSCSPYRGCACRADRSEALEPNGSNRRTTSPRKTDLGRISPQAATDFDPSPRPPSLPVGPAESPPRGSPLYLRHARLLI
ncbi:hypothetical protein [Planctomyces sp. SH-PL62]|uniref:hypothetical protein n=1 Tax=Planctomyces sp. SH-PL62 TaxID=1636152 RepID=UPI00078E3D64|nr:hypothetical protein [Planctomyces sp. SH-PL62]AMV37895.1 hypothetical protein VT85_10685 [Planctomyces sp. SH-PL62]